MTDKTKFSTLMATLGFTAAASAAPVIIAAAPGVEGEGAEPRTVSAEQMEGTLQAAHDQGVLAGTTAGFQAATTRLSAVMASDAAKANPQGAIAMLGNDKLASLSADEITGMLPTFGAPAASAPAAQTNAGLTPATIEADNAEIKKVDLKNGGPASQMGSGGNEQIAAEQGLDQIIAGVNGGSVSASNHLPGSVYGKSIG